MNINRRRRWRIIRSFGIGWIVAFAFLAIVRGSGTSEEGSVDLGLELGEIELRGKEQAVAVLAVDAKV